MVKRGTNAGSRTTTPAKRKKLPSASANKSKTKRDTSEVSSGNSRSLRCSASRKNQKAKPCSETEASPSTIPSPSPRGAKSTRKCPTPSPQAPVPVTVEEIGVPIIKSPLDTHGYKMVRLKENRLRGLLISTCLHPRDVDRKSSPQVKNPKFDCVFDTISEFNETYCNFTTKTGSGSTNATTSSKPSSSIPFSKATAAQMKKTVAKRNKFKGTKKAPTVKCRQGIHEQDDDMQSFCNNKCVVNLYVKAGFFQDPHDVPGMAHFCEHVLTLGSKKFPEPEALTKFVESLEGDGYYNALTESEYTGFHFYVDYKHIDHALEILADNFTNPIFKEEAIPNEIGAMNSEFENKRIDDAFRLWKLYQSCVIDGHPASNFGLGSGDSLTQKNKWKTKDSIKLLRDWMSQYYCTENMIFGIQGPKSLEELEKLFAKHFSSLPKRFGDFPECSCPIKQEPGLSDELPPINLAKWNRLYHLTSTSNNNSMSVAWALKPKFGTDVETRPLSYFTYIFVKKEEGSLDWYLRRSGWIVNLDVNYPGMQYVSNMYYTLFTIHLELTQKGFDERIDILRAIFSYVKLIQQSKASEIIFDEVRQCQADLFHYRSDMNLNDPTVGIHFVDGDATVEAVQKLIVTLLHSNCPSKVLLDAFLITNYNPELLEEFAESLTPDNVMVVFTSKSFESKETEKEKWFQARYYTLPLCPLLKAELEKNVPYPEFSFPKPNPFMQVSACYRGRQFLKDKIQKKDELLIYQTPKGEVSYGNSKCQRGLLPSANYQIQFCSRILEDSTELYNVPSIDIFLLTLKYVLDTELALAFSSMISYQVSWEIGSVVVSISGPSSKLPPLARKILTTVSRIREGVEPLCGVLPDLIKFQSGLYKNQMYASEECAPALLEYIVSQRSFFLSDFVQILENTLKVEDFLLFLEDFQSRLCINADLTGCVMESQAQEFSDCLDALPIVPYRRKKEYFVYGRAIQLPVGERCLPIVAKNQECRTVAVYNYYQTGDNEDDHEILVSIFNYLSNQAFEVLRARESLGYTVDMEWRDAEKLGIPGILIRVIGAADKHTCGFINEKIDQFLLDEYCQCFSSTAAFKQSIKKYIEQAESNFSLAETRSVYEKYLLPSGSHFRKLSVQHQGFKKEAKSKPSMPAMVEKKVARFSSGRKLRPCGSGVDGGSCGVSSFSKYLELDLKRVKEENGYFITDIEKFKKSLPCFGNLAEDLSEETA